MAAGTRESTTSRELIESALAAVSPEERDTWVRMGMAVHAALGDEGCDLWLRWSQGSHKFIPRDADSVWRSFRGGGSIGPGTLFWEAKRNGWRAPQSPEMREKIKAIAERDRRRIEWEAEQRKREASAAGARAEARLKQAKLVAGLQYAKKKGIDKVGRTSRTYLSSGNGDLLVPVRRLEFSRRMGARGGQVLALQEITAAGRKRFLPAGCAVSGGAHVLAGRGGGRRVHWHCEGFASGMAARIALDLRSDTACDAVVVGFSAHGMAGIAAKCAGIGGEHRVIADHDRVSMIGKRAGEEAAKRTGLPFWMPPTEGTDANDFFLEFGPEMLRSRLVLIRG